LVEIGLLAESLDIAGLDVISLRRHDDPADSIRLIGERVIPGVSTLKREGPEFF
jgi:hypothetical protein